MTALAHAAGQKPKWYDLGIAKSTKNPAILAAILQSGNDDLTTIAAARNAAAPLYALEGLFESRGETRTALWALTNPVLPDFPGHSLSIIGHRNRNRLGETMAEFIIDSRPSSLDARDVLVDLSDGERLRVIERYRGLDIAYAAVQHIKSKTMLASVVTKYPDLPPGVEAALMLDVFQSIDDCRELAAKFPGTLVGDRAKKVVSDYDRTRNEKKDRREKGQKKRTEKPQEKTAQAEKPATGLPKWYSVDIASSTKNPAILAAILQSGNDDRVTQTAACNPAAPGYALEKAIEFSPACLTSQWALTNPSLPGRIHTSTANAAARLEDQEIIGLVFRNRPESTDAWTLAVSASEENRQWIVATHPDTDAAARATTFVVKRDELLRIIIAAPDSMAAEVAVQRRTLLTDTDFKWIVKEYPGTVVAKEAARALADLDQPLVKREQTEFESWFYDDTKKLLRESTVEEIRQYVRDHLPSKFRGREKPVLEWALGPGRKPKKASGEEGLAKTAQSDQPVVEGLPAWFTAENAAKTKNPAVLAAILQSDRPGTVLEAAAANPEAPAAYLAKLVKEVGQAPAFVRAVNAAMCNPALGNGHHLRGSVVVPEVALCILKNRFDSEDAKVIADQADWKNPEAARLMQEWMLKSLESIDGDSLTAYKIAKHATSPEVVEQVLKRHPNTEAGAGAAMNKLVPAELKLEVLKMAPHSRAGESAAGTFANTDLAQTLAFVEPIADSSGAYKVVRACVPNMFFLFPKRTFGDTADRLGRFVMAHPDSWIAADKNLLKSLPLPYIQELFEKQPQSKAAAVIKEQKMWPISFKKGEADGQTRIAAGEPLPKWFTVENATVTKNPAILAAILGLDRNDETVWFAAANRAAPAYALEGIIAKHAHDEEWSRAVTEALSNPALGNGKFVPDEFVWHQALAEGILLNRFDSADAGRAAIHLPMNSEHISLIDQWVMKYPDGGDPAITIGRVSRGDLEKELLTKYPNTDAGYGAAMANHWTPPALLASTVIESPGSMAAKAILHDRSFETADQLFALADLLGNSREAHVLVKEHMKGIMSRRERKNRLVRYIADHPDFSAASDVAILSLLPKVDLDRLAKLYPESAAGRTIGTFRKVCRKSSVEDSLAKTAADKPKWYNVETARDTKNPAILSAILQSDNADAVTKMAAQNPAAPVYALLHVLDNIPVLIPHVMENPVWTEVLKRQPDSDAAMQIMTLATHNHLNVDPSIMAAWRRRVKRDSWVPRPLRQMYEEGKSDLTTLLFDIADGLWWYCSDYVGGQDSVTYHVLSLLGYRPGANESAPVDEQGNAREGRENAAEVYSVLVAQSTTPQQVHEYYETLRLREGKGP